MALRGRAVCGAAHPNLFSTVPAVGGGNAWVIRNFGAKFAVSSAATLTSAGMDVYVGYLYVDADLAPGDKVGFWRVAIGSTFGVGLVGAQNNTWLPAIYDATGTALAQGTTPLNTRTVYRVEFRCDGTNHQIRVNGALHVSRADSALPAITGLDFWRVENESLQNLEPAQGRVLYNTVVASTGLAAEFPTSPMPEARALHPNGQGTHNDFVGNPDTTNKYLNWDDWATGLADDDASRNEGTHHTTGVKRQTSHVQDVTFTNQVCVAQPSVWARLTAANKSLEIGMLAVEAGVTAELGVAALSSTAYGRRFATFWQAPNGQPWTQERLNGAEFGVRRNATTDDQAVVIYASALGVEAGALGATEFAPGPPDLGPPPVEDIHVLAAQVFG